ncbi:hypothetical protein CCP2SC5_1980003 [Azospirillaceae bacterium]
MYSNVSTLILTGVYDTMVPTSLAETVASTLRSAQILRFRNVGHDVYAADACSRDSVAQFINNPNVKVDAPCLRAPKPFKFTIRSPNALQKS